MANNSLIRQRDTARLLRAAKAAGFGRARVINYPDGRIEVVGENGAAPIPEEPISPFEQWKAKNANED